MERRTIDPSLAAWLPPLGCSAAGGERGTAGPQRLLADGDPDVVVEPAEGDWLRVSSWSRGRFEGVDIEGRVDIVQAWMALFMLQERRRHLGRFAASEVMRVPFSVAAPDGPLTVVVDDLRTALLVEDGVTVARLPGHPVENASAARRSSGRPC